MPFPSFISCMAIIKPKESWDIFHNAVRNQKLSVLKREILAKKSLSPDQKFHLLLASSSKRSFPLLYSCSYTALFTTVSKQSPKLVTNVWPISPVCSPLLREERCEQWSAYFFFLSRDCFKFLLCVLICIYGRQGGRSSFAVEASRQTVLSLCRTSVPGGFYSTSCKQHTWALFLWRRVLFCQMGKVVAHSISLKYKDMYL